MAKRFSLLTDINLLFDKTDNITIDVTQDQRKLLQYIIKGVTAVNKLSVIYKISQCTLQIIYRKFGCAWENIYSIAYTFIVVSESYIDYTANWAFTFQRMALSIHIEKLLRPQNY